MGPESEIARCDPHRGRSATGRCPAAALAQHPCPPLECQVAAAQNDGRPRPQHRDLFAPRRRPAWNFRAVGSDSGGLDVDRNIVEFRFNV